MKTAPLRLRIPREPLEGKAQGFARAIAKGNAGTLDAVAWIDIELWDHWGRRLADVGIDRRTFTATIDGLRRELWLWMASERTWADVTRSLVARLERRRPL